MNLRKLIFVNNDCYKAGRTITPKGIMVHSTGANNPNLKRYVGPDDGLAREESIQQPLEPGQARWKASLCSWFYW